MAFLFGTGNKGSMGVSTDDKARKRARQRKRNANPYRRDTQHMVSTFTEQVASGNVENIGEHVVERPMVLANGSVWVLSIKRVHAAYDRGVNAEGERLGTHPFDFEVGFDPGTVYNGNPEVIEARANADEGSLSDDDDSDDE